MVANVDCLYSVLSSMGYHYMDLNDFTTDHSPFPTTLDQVFIGCFIVRLFVLPFVYTHHTLVRVAHFYS